MNPSPETFVAAASNAYHNQLQSDIDNPNQPADLNNQRYTIFGYKENPATGFHATAYENTVTHEVIIAYRGTDPDLLHHTRTTAQDAAVDYTMVRARLNPQEDDARAFTQEMLDKAQKLGIPKEQVFVTGHSLGGTLAEIEASRFQLRGMTINAYGAVDLGYGVPEGGSMVTNYVMAGDPVSAASRHYGHVVPLASDQDIAKLHDARYINAPPGAAEPNPLLGMSMGDHGIAANFSGPDSILAPDRLAHARQNYVDNKAAIDRFRNDVYQSRTELAVALNGTDYLNLQSTWAHLSPRMQQQLAEYHASLVDAPIQNATEHNFVVEGAKQRLDQASAALQAGGQHAQQGADQLAQGFHVAGQAILQHADEVSRGAMTFAQVDPLAAGSAALGVKAAGYAIHAEAEGYAQASHLAGQATHAAGQLVTDQVQTAKHAVELGARGIGVAGKTVVHGNEVAAAVAADGAIRTHHDLQTDAQLLGYAYGATKDAVARGIDTVWHGASDAFDRLSHPTREAPPALSSDDPRQAASPHHALYQELHERIPDAGEKRLLQFTAACHAGGITQKNIGPIAYDEHRGVMYFMTASELRPPVAVDVKTPSPEPQHSVQHIQQHDQQQMQWHAQSQAQLNAQAQQGPALGGPGF